jgi:hypothetical protein
LYRAISEDGQHFMVMHFEISNVPMSIFHYAAMMVASVAISFSFVSFMFHVTFIEVVE